MTRSCTWTALQKCRACFGRKYKMSVLHLVVSNRAHPGLDLLLASSSRIPQLQTRVLGLGSRVPIGHGRRKGFGLKLDLLRQELMLCPPLQPVLFTDAWDVLLQGSPDKLLSWLDTHPSRVLFAAETVKWPDKNLLYPVPLHFPFPFLNSGIIFGRAQDILRLLQVPYDMSTDDQQYYAEQFVAPDNSTIVLDHTAEFFLCMMGVSAADISFQNGKGVSFKGHQPFVLHLNNGATRIKWFMPFAQAVLGDSYVPLARQIVWKTYASGLDEWPWKFILGGAAALLLIMIAWRHRGSVHAA